MNNTRLNGSSRRDGRSGQSWSASGSDIQLPKFLPSSRGRNLPRYRARRRQAASGRFTVIAVALLFLGLFSSFFVQQRERKIQYIDYAPSLQR
jgi:hypothetical protein